MDSNGVLERKGRGRGKGGRGERGEDKPSESRVRTCIPLKKGRGERDGGEERKGRAAEARDDARSE